MASSLNFEPRTQPTPTLDSQLAWAAEEADCAGQRFCCRLDDQPDHLVPDRYLRGEVWEGLADRRFLITPHCQLLPPGALPDAVLPLAPWLENFELQAQMVWIKDPEAGLDQPFWLGPAFQRALDGIQPGGDAPGGLSLLERRVLATAGLLVPREGGSPPRSQWARRIAECNRRFRQDEYAPIRGLLHPFHVSALRRYYRTLLRRGKLKFGDNQTARRYVAYNESVLRFFHHQLASTIGAMAGEAVKPSYVYLGSYQGGSELPPHTDREQCEFTVSLCLDFSPEPKNQTAWPLHLETSRGRTAVFQDIGDALLYRGTKIPHSRGPLPADNTSTSIFFHYVNQSFRGSLD